MVTVSAGSLQSAISFSRSPPLRYRTASEYRPFTNGRNLRNSVTALCDGVAKNETALGHHYGHRDAWKSSASPCVENAAWLHSVTSYELHYRKRVKHMMQVKIVHVLSGHDIDFRVPSGVQRAEHCDPFPLLRSHFREISEYNVLVHFLIVSSSIRRALLSLVLTVLSGMSSSSAISW